jgi:hypothetical protein
MTYYADYMDMSYFIVLGFFFGDAGDWALGLRLAVWAMLPWKYFKE